MASNQRKMFGTDGIRGVANLEPVTAETALKLGRAAAHVFAEAGVSKRRTDRRPVIVIGKDTRLSGYMLENALAAGIMSMGVDVFLLGPIPTPGVAYITRSLRADAGIVLSASHNHYADNGIKFFRHDGYKLDDEIEHRIEHLVMSGEIENIRPVEEKIGQAKRIDDALGRYVEQAKSSFPKNLTLEGMHIAVDAANGAAYKSTPWILGELGATITVTGNHPNGRNINAECGSTYPDAICRMVKSCGASVGVSHDGDADRVILCDENGDVVDGDEILAIAALDAIRRGELAKNTLVATVMSNFGLDETLRDNHGRVLRTKVGDRYVLEAMLAQDLNIGGEQSGHMIFRDYSTTGDGIVSALQILRIMAETGRPLSELKRCLKKYPQAQRNMIVREKPAIETMPDVVKLIRETEAELGDAGRVLLRYSGTEPKIRLLIEGRDGDQINKQADRIADLVLGKIGAK